MVHAILGAVSTKCSHLLRGLSQFVSWDGSMMTNLFSWINRGNTLTSLWDIIRKCLEMLVGRSARFGIGLGLDHV
jgi:hypothetical protein